MPEHELIKFGGHLPVRLLLAEDDPGHAALIRRHLHEVGIANEVHHFEDGEKLLEFLNGEKDEHVDFNKPYLLLLDIRMPRLSGEEVLARIKQDPRLKLMPVVMLTTTDDPKEIRRCFELGCNEYITKPVEYEKFVAAIKRLGMFLQIVSVPPLEG